MKLQKQQVYLSVTDFTEHFVVLSNEPDFEQDVVKEERFVFSEEEFRELLSSTYDDVWDKTGDGWNGEIQPIELLLKPQADWQKIDSDVYLERKKEYINNLLKQD